MPHPRFVLWKWITLFHVFLHVQFRLTPCRTKTTTRKLFAKGTEKISLSYCEPVVFATQKCQCLKHAERALGPGPPDSTFPNCSFQAPFTQDAEVLAERSTLRKALFVATNCSDSVCFPVYREHFCILCERGLSSCIETWLFGEKRGYVDLNKNPCVGPSAVKGSLTHLLVSLHSCGYGGLGHLDHLDPRNVHSTLCFKCCNKYPRFGAIGNIWKKKKTK